MDVLSCSDFCSLACLILPSCLFAYALLAAEEAGLLLLSIVIHSSKWSSYVRPETDKASSVAVSETRLHFLGQSFSAPCICDQLYPFLGHEFPGKPHFLCRISSRLGPPDSGADVLCSSRWCRGRARDFIGPHAFCG